MIPNLPLQNFINNVPQIGNTPPLDIGCLEPCLIVPIMYVFEWMLQKVILGKKAYSSMNILLHGESRSGKTLLSSAFSRLF